MKETFSGKTYKAGDSTVITIPAFLIKDKRIELGAEYSVTISDED